MAHPRAGFLVAIALTLAGGAGAAESTANYLYPVAGQRGTTVSLKAGGPFAAWPPQVWADAPGLVFKSAPEKGKLTVEIADDAAPGPHLVRFYGPQGASAPCFFLVETGPVQLEAEPNDDFKSPQKIEGLPATICGRLDKSDDVDSFAVTLRRGQPLTASLDAFVLGSPFDGMLRIVDSEETQLAFNHDGRTLDPLLAWTAPRDGTFIVQLMGFAYPPGSNVSFAGSDSCIYRLRLVAEPPPPDALPPSTLPQQLESEPNDTIAQAATVAIPGAVVGTIQRAGDEDRFAFTAVKGTAYDIAVSASRYGSPLDAWLKIEAQDGREVARSDDNGPSLDPRLTWTAPADGVFVAALGDVTHHGDREYFYRLSLQPPQPANTAWVTNESVVLAPGKEVGVKVSLKRATGYSANLQLVAKDLPPGVTAPEVDLPAKGEEVTLKLAAAEGAEPVSQPLRIVLREQEGGHEFPVHYYLPVNGQKLGETDLLIDSTDVLWIAVTAKPSEPAKPAAD